MKITISIYEDKEISRFVYVNEFNKEWDMLEHEWGREYSSIQDWAFEYKPHAIEPVTLEIHCELIGLSYRYLYKEYPELCL